LPLPWLCVFYNYALVHHRSGSTIHSVHLEVNWNEFDLRNYDPQIGRWTGMDPYDQFSSPYLAFGADPANSVDPDGGFAIHAPSLAAADNISLASGIQIAVSGLATGASSMANDIGDNIEKSLSTDIDGSKSIQSGGGYNR
jgi:RHS repeat-associated protein